MIARHDAVRAVQDPTTGAAALAQIAAEHPDLRPHVAAHPNAYPALLAWLAQLGDPAVASALGWRAQHRPGASSAAPYAAAPPPAQPCGTRPGPYPPQKQSRLGLWLGAGIVATALVVTGAVMLPGLLGAGSASGQLRAYPSPPTESWTIDAGDVLAAAGARAEDPYLAGFEAVGDLGVAVVWDWTQTDDGASYLAGVSMADGTILWTARRDGSVSCDALPGKQVACLDSSSLTTTYLDATTGSEVSAVTDTLGMDPATGQVVSGVYTPGDTSVRLRLLDGSGEVWGRDVELTRDQRDLAAADYSDVYVGWLGDEIGFTVYGELDPWDDDGDGEYEEGAFTSFLARSDGSVRTTVGGEPMQRVGPWLLVREDIDAADASYRLVASTGSAQVELGSVPYFPLAVDAGGTSFVFQTYSGVTEAYDLADPGDLLWRIQDLPGYPYGSPLHLDPTALALTYVDEEGDASVRVVEVSDGSTRWTGAGRIVGSDGGRLVLRDEDALVARHIEDGSEAWSMRLGSEEIALQLEDRIGVHDLDRGSYTLLVP